MPSAGANLASLATHSAQDKTPQKCVSCIFSLSCAADAFLWRKFGKRGPAPAKASRPAAAPGRRDARARRGGAKAQRTARPPADEARSAGPDPGSRESRRGQTRPGERTDRLLGKTRLPPPPWLGPMGLAETARAPSAMIGWRKELRLSRAWVLQQGPRRGTGRPRHPVPQHLSWFARRSWRAIHCVTVSLRGASGPCAESLLTTCSFVLVTASGAGRQCKSTAALAIRRSSRGGRRRKQRRRSEVFAAPKAPERRLFCCTHASALRSALVPPARGLLGDAASRI